MRRGGARHELTERIRLVGPNLKLRDGWALNISRGGVRAILEEAVELGEEYEVTVGEEGGAPLTRKARVVWIQEEPDGLVVGFEFLYLSGAQTVPAELRVDDAPAKADDKPEE